MGTPHFVIFGQTHNQKMISSLGDEIWRTALPFVSLIIHEKSQYLGQTDGRTDRQKRPDTSLIYYYVTAN